MILPKHHNALDVISVLLFSLLANFILPLQIDFSSTFNYAELARLLLLSASSILFYIVVTHIKEIATYSRSEYDAETTIEAKARRSTDDRYKDYYRPQSGRITAGITLAILCGIAFFLVEPITRILA